MKQMDKAKLSLFWHRNNEIVPISDSVAIYQIYGGADSIHGEVVFKCRPEADEFMYDPVGRVEVRYDCIPIDNPLNGELVCTISDIKRDVFAIDDLTKFDPAPEALEFIMRTKAEVRWEWVMEVWRRNMEKDEDD